MNPTRRSRLRQVAVIGASASAILAPFLVYVWGNVQIVSRGYQIEATATRIHELEQENRALRLERARLEAAARIEERARKLGFAPLPPSRIVTLADARVETRRETPALPASDADSSGKPAAARATP